MLQSCRVERWGLVNECRLIYQRQQLTELLNFNSLNFKTLPLCLQLHFKVCEQIKGYVCSLQVILEQPFLIFGPEMPYL